MVLDLLSGALRRRGCGLDLLAEPIESRGLDGCLVPQDGVRLGPDTYLDQFKGETEVNGLIPHILDLVMVGMGPDLMFRHLQDRCLDGWCGTLGRCGICPSWWKSLGAHADKTFGRRDIQQDESLSRARMIRLLRNFRYAMTIVLAITKDEHIVKHRLMNFSVFLVYVDLIFPSLVLTWSWVIVLD